MKSGTLHLERRLDAALREANASKNALLDAIRERDGARAEMTHWRDACAEAQVKLDTRHDVEAERDRLRALLREVEEYHDECQFCGAWKRGHEYDCRLKAALEGRDAV